MNIGNFEHENIKNNSNMIFQFSLQSSIFDIVSAPYRLCCDCPFDLCCPRFSDEDQFINSKYCRVIESMPQLNANSLPAGDFRIRGANISRI